tara:strand:+ start:1451 stop:1765 length:315 start_codon:yes stop_codon:yes gene_type:complete
MAKQALLIRSYEFKETIDEFDKALGDKPETEPVDFLKDASYNDWVAEFTKQEYKLINVVVSPIRPHHLIHYFEHAPPLWRRISDHPLSLWILLAICFYFLADKN